MLGQPAGTADEPRWLWRYLATAALIAGVVCARRMDAITNPQFWAEDGCLFFLENATLGFWKALGAFYHDFPYLLPRLIAFLGGLAPVADGPRIYTTSAIVLTACALATFALPAFRHFVRSDVLRVVWGVAVASIPSFGQEVLSTPTNLGWFVAIWLTLVSLMRLPRQRWRLALLGAAAGVALFSTPLAIMTLPFWALRAYRAVLRNDRRELGLSLALVALLAGAVLVSRGLGAITTITLGSRTIGFSPAGWLKQSGLQVVGLLFPPSVGAAIGAMGTGAVGAVGVLVLAGFVLAARVSGWHRVGPLLLALALASGAQLLTQLGRVYVNLVLDRSPSGRYTVYPAAMLTLAAIVAVDGLPRGATRRSVGGVLLALTVWAWAPSFVIAPFEDHQWRAQAVQVEHALRSACPANLLVPMNPSFPPLRIEWGPALPERPVPPASVVATLEANGTFRQPFVSQCDELSNVELFLDESQPSAAGTLVFSLLDDSGVLRTVRIARADVTRHGWQLFCFAPIQGSSGRRFTVELRTIENDRAAALQLLGSTTDPGSPGNAQRGGRSGTTEAALRYACRTHLPRACFRWRAEPLLESRD